jgi:hypothetical protein
LERETRVNSASENSVTDYSSRPYPYPYDEYGHSGSDNGYTSEVSSDSQETVQTQESAEPTQTAPEQAQIEGTVPRSNGVQPVEPVPVAVEEDRRG